MQRIIVLFIVACFVFVNGQDCHAKIDQSIVGYCSSSDKCQGTLVDSNNICEQQLCCISGSAPPASPACITGGEFNALYSTPRAGFLRRILNYAVNKAGICSNCYAKAAFLAVAATMTNDFTNDEAIGSDDYFAEDDDKYGNDQPGDGSRFRRRGFFGLRGKEMYRRLQNLMPQYKSLDQPEAVAIVENGMDITAKLWNNPNLLNETSLTQYANGTLYGFSMLWYKVNGDLIHFADAVKHYVKFLRAMKCVNNLYSGAGPVCQYNETHNGTCRVNCITGLEDFGEYCGCSGDIGPLCYSSLPIIRCCVDQCSQNFDPFTNEICSEPTLIPPNSTITGELGHDKYTFLKIKIKIVGKKILITVILFNGNVKLHFSFTSRNPKDPSDFLPISPEATFESYDSTKDNRMQHRRDRAVTLSIDIPAAAPEFVYIGVKGIEPMNKFEVKFDDCGTVDCKANSLATSNLKQNIVLFFGPCVIFLMKTVY